MFACLFRVHVWMSSWPVLRCQCFVCDFTYELCHEGLVLGCIGPVGLRLSEAGPTMRMIPAFYVLSSAEDYDAHEVLLRLYFDSLHAKGQKATHGFFDCSCMQSVMNFCKAEGISLYCHRCLQHVKTNCKDQSAKRDPVTGKARLQNRELLGPLIQWLEFSAWLPNDLEFDTMWKSILRRLESSEAETDFNEPQMAAYLRHSILDVTGILPSSI